MKKDIDAYTVRDLLEDDLFLEYVKYPTEENSRYWERLQKDHPKLEVEVKKARDFIVSIGNFSQHLEERELQEIWQKIEKQCKYKKHQRRGKRLLWLAGIAAIVAISVDIGLALLVSEEGMEMMAVPVLSNNANETELVVAGQSTIQIKEKESELQYTQHGGIKVNSKTIAIDSQKIVSEVAYHQLIVPNGRRSSITFADGTKIWVNAGSRMVFPADFGTDKRRIYVEGEVFLDVAQDRSRPFIVMTKQFSVKVYGTSFNVAAYLGEARQSVVLVTGKVEVKTNDQQKITLTPNDMFLYQEGKSFVKLVDVYDYIAWKDGLYRFCNEKVSDILSRLAKYYGVEITWEDAVQGLTCSGKLDLKEKLADVLKGLAETAPLEYVYSQESIVVKCTKLND